MGTKCALALCNPIQSECAGRIRAGLRLHESEASCLHQIRLRLEAIARRAVNNNNDKQAETWRRGPPF